MSKLTPSSSTAKRSSGATPSRINYPRPPNSTEKKREPSQLARAFALGSYFVSGLFAINTSQFLGAPLYLVNQDWYNAWIAFTKESWGLLIATMTQCWAPTIVRVSGDKSVRGQLLQSREGNLQCEFPNRLILIANHQIYTDWLYLWWIGYTAGMHGHIYIILKESLKRIPIIGWGMQFYRFIFLKRNWELDKPRLASHMQKLNNPRDPMWLMMFPEGTNLAPTTREASKKWADKNGLQDMRYQLLPRSTGLQFCLQQLKNTVDYVYDCTIAYEGVSSNQYAQDIFTVQASYLGGRPPVSVNMHWRRFRVDSIPFNDSTAFDKWLRDRWSEKDQLLGIYYRTGRFPADKGTDKGLDGKTRRGAGYIETEIKSARWYEFLQIFAPIGLFALVLYMFYGAIPKQLASSPDKQIWGNTMDILHKALAESCQKSPSIPSNKLVTKSKTGKYAPATHMVAPKAGMPRPRPNQVKNPKVSHEDRTVQPKAMRKPAQGTVTGESKISGSRKQKTITKKLPVKSGTGSSGPVMEETTKKVIPKKIKSEQNPRPARKQVVSKPGGSSTPKIVSHNIR